MVRAARSRRTPQAQGFPIEGHQARQCSPGAQGVSMMDGAGTSESHRTPNGGLAEVGAMLRDRRVELGHDIQAVARQTHIKVSYLKAIEEGRRRDLPGAAYTIGFVRTYADFLGLDGNRLVTDFHAQLAGARARPAGPGAPPTQESRRLTISPVMVAGAVLAFALVGFFLWGYLSDIGGDAGDSAVEEVAEGEEAPAEAAAPADAAPAEAATAEQAAEDSAVTPAPAATSADGSGSGAAGTDQAAPAGDQPADQTADQPADQTGDQAASEDRVPPEAAAADAAEPDAAEVQQATAAEGDAAGKVVLRARLESWVQITNEKGEAIFSRVLRAGETYTVPAEPGLMMTTGNAGGIEILLDGKKLKSLGSVGLVRRDFPLDAKKLKDGSAFKPGTNAQTTQ